MFLLCLLRPAHSPLTFAHTLEIPSGPFLFSGANLVRLSIILSEVDTP